MVTVNNPDDRATRADDGAVVWYQFPWELQRSALWLFATFCLALALTQPTPDRWLATAAAYVLVVVHAVIGPDRKCDRCGI